MSISLWPHGLYPARLFCPCNLLVKNNGIGSHFFLQVIFLTQGSNPSLLHCRQIAYHRVSREAPRGLFLFSHQVVSKFFAIPWTASCQASLSFSLLEFVQVHVHWISDALQPSHLLSLSSPSTFNLSQHPASFPMSQLFASGGQRIGASASASILPMNIQSLFPLGLTGLIFLKSKGLSRVFSNTTI